MTISWNKIIIDTGIRVPNTRRDKKNGCYSAELASSIQSDNEAELHIAIMTQKPASGFHSTSAKMVHTLNSQHMMTRKTNNAKHTKNWLEHSDLRIEGTRKCNSILNVFFLLSDLLLNEWNSTNITRYRLIRSPFLHVNRQFDVGKCFFRLFLQYNN